MARHDEELWALLSLGDAVDQFYRDTLEMIREKMLVSELSETHAMMVHWHIVSFERFAVAFDLMSRAYYFEAIALARDLWEIALSLAALKRDVISLRELLAAGATTSRDMETASRRGLQD